MVCGNMSKARIQSPTRSVRDTFAGPGSGRGNSFVTTGMREESLSGRRLRTINNLLKSGTAANQGTDGYPIEPGVVALLLPVSECS